MGLAGEVHLFYFDSQLRINLKLVIKKLHVNVVCVVSAMVCQGHQYHLLKIKNVNKEREETYIF